MLKSMRDSFHHLKWILLAVIAAFIIGFVYVDMGLGGGGGKTDDNTSYVARVNGETISQRDYDRARYFTEENYKRMYGDRMTPEMLAQMGLDKQVLDMLIDQRLLLQQAGKLHLTASSEEVRKRILAMPALNPEGKFVGTEYYTRFVVGQLRYSSPAEFEDDLGNQITVDKMESALSNSLVVSPKTAEAEYRRNAENAKIRYVIYPAIREAGTAVVTPADVDAYYKAHPDKYTHGEQRQLKYLVADTNRIRSQITPTPQEIQQRYDVSKDQFKTKTAAHVLHILIKVPAGAPPSIDTAAKAKADALAAQIRGGADFGKLAQDNSGDPSSSSKGGDMGFVEQGATVAPFDAAIFNTPLNQVAVVRSQEYGYHIIKVLERRDAGFKPLAEVQSQIASQISDEKAKDAAREAIAAIASRLKDKKPGTADEFAANANDKVSSNDTQWFQKADQIPGLGYNPAISTWAFGAKKGDVSDVLGTQRGPAIAYMEGTRPAGITALEEIHQKVEQDARMDKARQAASAKVAAAMAGATTVDAVAAKLGMTATEANVSRQGYIPGITGDTTPVVDATMSTAVGQLKGPVVAGDGAMVLQVLEQKKLGADDIQKNLPAVIESLRSQEARSLRTSLLQRLRKAANIVINDKFLQRQQQGQQQPAQAGM